MTKKSMLNTVGILKDMFLINHPHAEFQSDEKLLKGLHKRGLVPVLKYLNEKLKIAPDRNIEAYLVPVQKNRILAVDLSQFFLDSDLVLNSGEPVREKLYIPFRCSVSGKDEEGTVLVPAIVSEGTEYPLVTENEIPGALRFLRGGFAVPPSVFSELN
jgi:hypothetical protein